MPDKTVVQDNVTAMLKSVQALIKNEVLVGIPNANADRKPLPDEKTAIDNATLGYIMETGSPANNIPARPFLVPGVESVKDKIVQQMKKGGVAALEGKMGELANAQSATGLIAQLSVKAKITSNIPPALAQRTLEDRERRGVTRTNTLVDTGQLLNAITYVVRPRGAK